jgi:hypothetical protein
MASRTGHTGCACTLRAPQRAIMSRVCPGGLGSTSQPMPLAVGAGGSNSGAGGGKRSTTIKLPFHWSTSGATPSLSPVHPGAGTDYGCVTESFINLMTGGGGRSCTVDLVDRVENQATVQCSPFWAATI